MPNPYVGIVNQAPRLHNLDYLRGIAATGIMLYHLGSWYYGAFSPESVMGRIGVYGVAIFYVLSGLTMYHVYGSRMETPRDLKNFFIRRGFRIMPLLWLVTIAALIIVPRDFRWSDLALNLTGLFGFISWDTYFSPGIWSIGNELVFYAIFPIIVVCAKTKGWVFAAAGFIIGSGFLCFTFVLMSPREDIGSQWYLYVNPANQAFLFFAGIMIAYFSKRVRMQQPTGWAVIVVSMIIFVAWPVIGKNTVTDGGRLVLTLTCVAICAAAYHIDLQMPKVGHVPLAFLGEASYSIYLLHPIVNELVRLTPLKTGPKPVVIVAIAVGTLVVSWFVYRWFEKPMISIGRRLTARRE